MLEANEFQKTTQHELLTLLGELGVAPSRVEITGRDNATVEIDTGGVKLWIYSDGACIIGNGADFVYERWDYDDLGALREEFLRRVRKVISKA